MITADFSEMSWYLQIMFFGTFEIERREVSTGRHNQVPKHWSKSAIPVCKTYVAEIHYLMFFKYRRLAGYKTVGLVFKYLIQSTSWCCRTFCQQGIRYYRTLEISANGNCAPDVHKCDRCLTHGPHVAKSTALKLIQMVLIHILHVPFQNLKIFLLEIKIQLKLFICSDVEQSW